MNIIQKKLKESFIYSKSQSMIRPSPAEQYFKMKTIFGEVK